MSATMSMVEIAARLRAAGCVFAEAEAELLLAASVPADADLEAMIRRRCAGEPLELVVGWADFGGMRITVASGVFLPRQRTIRMLDRAVQLLRVMDEQRPVVVDLGTGSGALARGVATRTSSEVYAIDCSAEAVACAATNLADTPATVLRGWDLEVLPRHLRGRVDLVLANLPYVPTAEVGLLPREARLYEPASTLDGGVDGLVPLRRGLASALAWLKPSSSASYLAEISAGQVPAARRIAAISRTDVVIDPDDAGSALAEFRPIQGEAQPSR